jgi:hypothetical protein
VDEMMRTIDSALDHLPVWLVTWRDAQGMILMQALRDEPPNWEEITLGGDMVESMTWEQR